MKFLLSGDWQKKTTQYYRNSLESENEGSFATEFSETSQQGEEKQKELQVALEKTILEEQVHRIEQTKLSAFIRF